jgi:hypothetical protein
MKPASITERQPCAGVFFFCAPAQLGDEAHKTARVFPMKAGVGTHLSAFGQKGGGIMPVAKVSLG